MPGDRLAGLSSVSSGSAAMMTRVWRTATAARSCTSCASRSASASSSRAALFGVLERPVALGERARRSSSSRVAASLDRRDPGGCPGSRARRPLPPRPRGQLLLVWSRATSSSFSADPSRSARHSEDRRARGSPRSPGRRDPGGGRGSRARRPWRRRRGVAPAAARLGAARARAPSPRAAASRSDSHWTSGEAPGTHAVELLRQPLHVGGDQGEALVARGEPARRRVALGHAKHARTGASSRCLVSAVRFRVWSACCGFDFPCANRAAPSASHSRCAAPRCKDGAARLDPASERAL